MNKHYPILFVISKNRNSDVTNKFFQLKIVDYFTHEIQLEHEVAEKVYKLNQYNNNQRCTELLGHQYRNIECTAGLWVWGDNAPRLLRLPSGP